VENTVSITAADVNKLRQITGAGMMDCKKALTEANGDFEKAIEILRKKGQKVAANRSDRNANEGYVLGLTTADKKTAVLIALNCETDFVAKNADFVDFATKVANIAIDKLPASKEALLEEQIDGRSINDHIIDMVGKIGEKIELGYYGDVKGEYVLAYNHPGNRVGTIVALNKNVADAETIAKDVAMQAAAMAPVALDKADVPQDVIEKEIEIAKDLLRQEGKPEDKIEMIAKGKLEKFFKESTLLNQEFIKDNKMTVSQYLQKADKELTVAAFRRYALGQ
jgi:elongation factor Ts